MNTAADFLLSAIHSPGDVAEFGVYTGKALFRLLPIARRQGRTVWAVDSFCGMGKPGQYDGDNYPEGKFDTGGPGWLTERAHREGYSETLRVVAGLIPGVLPLCTATQYCFAHIDLDHYGPTLDTLRFVWPKLAPGGIIAVHDFLPGHKDLATRAVNEFASEFGLTPTLAGSTRIEYAVFRKPL